MILPSNEVRYCTFIYSRRHDAIDGLMFFVVALFALRLTRLCLC